MKINFTSKTIVALLLTTLMGAGSSYSQIFPPKNSNIPYLLSFGNRASTSWGDDDFSMSFFFTIPKNYSGQVYFRVFDPNVGGEIDEPRGDFNTRTRFEVYGGTGTFSHPDSRCGDPIGNYKAGTLLDEKTFGTEAEYDGMWYTFGPFRPDQGEYLEASNMEGYIFKVISEGIAGDDGNLFRYFVSSSPNSNIAIVDGQGFTFEYSFRLPDNNEVCHLFPYIDDQVVSVNQYNFDWDYDGAIRIVSRAKTGTLVATSGDGDWKESNHEIIPKEHHSTLDIQFIRTKGYKNNNVVFKIKNQYQETLPFYSIPIGLNKIGFE